MTVLNILQKCLRWTLKFTPSTLGGENEYCANTFFFVFSSVKIDLIKEISQYCKAAATSILSLPFCIQPNTFIYSIQLWEKEYTHKYSTLHSRNRACIWLWCEISGRLKIMICYYYWALGRLLCQMMVALYRDVYMFIIFARGSSYYLCIFAKIFAYLWKCFVEQQPLYPSRNMKYFVFYPITNPHQIYVWNKRYIALQKAGIGQNPIRAWG